MGSVELIHLPSRPLKKPGEWAHTHIAHVCAHILTSCTVALPHTHPRALTLMRMSHQRQCTLQFAKSLLIYHLI